MKTRSFVAKAEGVFPIYIQKKNEDGTFSSEKANDVEKVLIYKKSYVVAKGTVKKDDDVIVIRHGTKIGPNCPDWLKFVRHGNVRLSRKCGVMSHGVVIPTADAYAILKVDPQISMRSVDRPVIDKILDVKKTFTKREIKMISDCREEIKYFMNEIRKIEEA